jgi:hypothetical protein
MTRAVAMKSDNGRGSPAAQPFDREEVRRRIERMATNYMDEIAYFGAIDPSYSERARQNWRKSGGAAGLEIPIRWVTDDQGTFRPELHPVYVERMVAALESVHIKSNQQPPVSHTAQNAKLPGSSFKRLMQDRSR